MHALKLVAEIAVLPLTIYVVIPWQCLYGAVVLASVRAQMKRYVAGPNV